MRVRRSSAVRLVAIDIGGETTDVTGVRLRRPKSARFRPVIRRIGPERARCYDSPFDSSDVPECVVMAAVCEVCGEHPSFGMAVSHSHRRTKRRWNPNIQRVRAVVNGSTKRVNVCTSCLKAGKVVKAVR